MGERAGPADLNIDVRILRQRQHLRQLCPWLRRDRRVKGLLQAEVIDDNDGIGIPHRQLLGLVETTPNQHVHRQAVLSVRPGTFRVR